MKKKEKQPIFILSNRGFCEQQNYEKRIKEEVGWRLGIKKIDYFTWLSSIPGIKRKR
jgi:hypothetical protein